MYESIMKELKERFPNLLCSIENLSVEDTAISQDEWQLTFDKDMEVVGMIKQKNLLLTSTKRSDEALEVGFALVLEEYLNRFGRALFFRLFIVAYYTQRLEECAAPVELLMLDLSIDNGKSSVILEYFSNEELIETLDWLFWYVFVDGAEFGVLPNKYVSQANQPYLKAVQVLAKSIADRVRT